MDKYPKIGSSTADFPLKSAYAFNKYDGSNIRATWNKKQGFFKFGTRSRLIDKTDPDFGCAIPLVQETYGESLGKVFTDYKRFRGVEHMTIFCEFFGPNSFAGLHKKDDPKELMLFDVWLYKYGLMGPEDFLEHFERIKKAEVVYSGKMTGKFFDDVKQGRYNVAEGVVCKCGQGGRDLAMCKVKTNTYLEKLKKVFGESDWKNYWL